MKKVLSIFGNNPFAVIALALCLVIGQGLSLLATRQTGGAFTLSTAHDSLRAALGLPAAGGTAPLPSPTVLKPGDAALYRSAFAAAERGDHRAAEAYLIRVSDPRLAGFILAPRGGASVTSTSNLDSTSESAPTFADSRQPVWVFPRGWAPGHHARNASSPLTETPVALAQAAALAARLFYAGERPQARVLAARASEVGSPLGAWISGLIAWEDRDSAEAARQFERLATLPSLTPAERTAAHFWAWRALNATKNPGLARIHLQAAAVQSQTFYGLLAAQALAVTPSPEAAPSPEAILATTPEGAQALALRDAGQTVGADRELLALASTARPEIRQALRDVVQRDAASFPRLALRLQAPGRTASRSAGEKRVLPSWHPRQGFSVDRALMFALAQHESRLDPLAVSSRGARGLLQLMPSTAAAILGRSSSNDPDEADTDILARLQDPRESMDLGQRYLRQLMQDSRIGNNLVLVLASYNGGVGRVTHWRDNASSLATRDPLLFLEEIPLQETRFYVARVLTHYAAYRTRLGRSLHPLQRLAEGHWPVLPTERQATASGETTVYKVSAL